MNPNLTTPITDNGADASARIGQSNKIAEEGKIQLRTGESLRQDLIKLKTDLDTLLAQASNLSERELSDAYARMMTKFSSMRFAAKGIAAEATRQINQGVDKTSDYVKAKPLQSVAMAAGLGLMFGILIARR